MVPSCFWQLETVMENTRATITERIPFRNVTIDLFMVTSSISKRLYVNQQLAARTLNHQPSLYFTS
jgi:hypothetical protein